jgi:hypothetical protein
LAQNSNDNSCIFLYYMPEVRNVGYKVKYGNWSKYLTDQLQNPSIKMKVIWLEKLKVFYIKIVRQLLTQSSANAREYSEVRRNCHALYILDFGQKEKIVSVIITLTKSGNVPLSPVNLITEK